MADSATRLIDGRTYTVTVLAPVLPNPDRLTMRKRRRRGLRGINK